MPGKPVTMVGRSPAMERVFQLINLVADQTATVLITGESGTGKELAARAIHSRSPREKQPFLVINCGAIPENLLEDELFGHVKGACCTDARQERAGKLEQAAGGTLFLDEIGDLPPSLQVKLLQVLEEKSFQKPGSNRTLQVDVRIVVATHSDLREKVRQKEFREDLFHRLNGVPVHLPPLRQRREDLPLLVTHFLQRFSDSYRLPAKKLAPGALKRLMQHPWPGNVRELRNVLELACVLSGDERIILEVEDFAALEAEAEFDLEPTQWLNQRLHLPAAGLNLNDFLRQLQANLIREALERSADNKQKAAELLGLKRTTLVAKLKRFKL